jgi:hypothetical protein
MTSPVGVLKPISYAEDQIIRAAADDGYSPREMIDVLAKSGYRRNRLTIAGHMKSNGIVTSAIAYHARHGAPLRSGKQYRLEDRHHHYICPFEANDLFAAAFAAGSDGRLYQDDPRAAWKSRVFQPTWTRDYGANHMTTGGVAVYG